MATPLREVFARFGIEVDDKKLDGLNQKVNQGASMLQRFGAVLTGALGVGALASFANHLSETGSLIQDSARRLGLTTDAYQQLGYAAKVSGGSVEAMGAAVLGLQDRLVEAAKGGEAGKRFRELGIAAKDAHGNLRGTEEVFSDAADAIARMDNPARQTAAAMDLFGRSGRELLPMLKGGSAEINRLRKEAIELGGGFDVAAVAASDEFGDAMDRASLATTSLKGRLAAVLLPVLQRVVDGVTRAVAWFTRLVKETYLVQVALGVLGAALAAFALKAAIAMAPAIAPFVLMGALIGAIILIAEDLIVWFKGGKSAFGELLTAILGAEKAKAVLEGVRNAVKAISEWVGQTARDFRDFLRWVDEALSKLQALIGLRNAALAKGNSVDDQNAIRRQAIAGGGSVRFPGETQEQAKAANDYERAQQQATRALQPGGGGGMSVNAPVNAPITINAPNADARAVVRLIEDHVDRTLNARNNQAAQALTREAPKKR